MCENCDILFNWTFVHLHMFSYPMDCWTFFRAWPPALRGVQTRFGVGMMERGLGHCV